MPITTSIALIASLLLGALTTLTVTSPAEAAAVEAGYQDHSWEGLSSVSTPSQDKPQSKLWYTDGTWWAAMFTGDDHNIFSYNPATHTWTDTGVTVDDRNNSHGDYFWDEATDSLYVASVNGDGDTDPILVFKLTYDGSTYSHDPDFGPDGIEVGFGPSETVTIAKDSTGQLWVTFQNPGTSGRDIMVNRSTENEHTWGTAFSIGGASDDDISAIIAFGGDSVGVMWSDQNPSETQTFFYWSEHADAEADDTDWSTKQSSAQGTDAFAEDHVNLKLVATNSGEVLAAVKTNGGPDHIQLLRRSTGGTWDQHVVVGEGLSVTRPQVVVDASNSEAYVFYTAPEAGSTGEQVIYYKSAPLSNLDSFGGGLGTLLIKDSPNDINDISTAKHPVTSSMGGIVAIATSESNRTYYHGWISLGGEPEPENPFTDVDESNKFYADILWIAEEGITTGCNPSGTLFCPDGKVKRDQMATFLVRALDLPDATMDYFDDDEGNKHEDAINALREANITTGCGPAGKYCPNEAVTRGMMATFLVRAFDLLPTDEDYFRDDRGIFHEPNINALAESGITTGCAANLYCPNTAVKREQMAAFLHRAGTQ